MIFHFSQSLLSVMLVFGIWKYFSFEKREYGCIGIGKLNSLEQLWFHIDRGQNSTFIIDDFIPRWKTHIKYTFSRAIQNVNIDSKRLLFHINNLITKSIPISTCSCASVQLLAIVNSHQFIYIWHESWQLHGKNDNKKNNRGKTRERSMNKLIIFNWSKAPISFLNLVIQWNQTVCVKFWI